MADRPRCVSRGSSVKRRCLDPAEGFALEAAEPEGAVVLTDAGYRSEGLRRGVLKIRDDLSLLVDGQGPGVTGRLGLNPEGEAVDDLPQEGMRGEKVERGESR